MVEPWIYLGTVMTKRVLRYEMRNGVGSDWYVSYDLLDRACRMLKDTYCRLLLNGYDVIGTNGIMILSKCKKIDIVYICWVNQNLFSAEKWR